MQKAGKLLLRGTVYFRALYLPSVSFSQINDYLVTPQANYPLVPANKMGNEDDRSLCSQIMVSHKEDFKKYLELEYLKNVEVNL